MATQSVHPGGTTLQVRCHDAGAAELGAPTRKVRAAELPHLAAVPDRDRISFLTFGEWVVSDLTLATWSRRVARFDPGGVRNSSAAPFLRVPGGLLGMADSMVNNARVDLTTVARSGAMSSV